MSVVSYKCPNCGGNLVFDPESQSLKCLYCSSVLSKEQVECLKNASSAEACLYTCPSCGAEIITDAITSTTQCYYCHNPLVFTKQFSNEFKPSKILPFQKTKKEALDSFISWCHNKHFIPKDFTSPSQLQNITGLYIPYWLVDCQAEATLKGTAKNITSWVSSDYQYTKSDVYSVERAGVMNFNLLPHDASKKSDDRIMDSISPFIYKDLKDFSYFYLPGFISEKYDVSEEEVYPIIKRRVEKSAEKELRSSINGYTTVSILHKHTNITETNFYYTLMPVWMLTYIYKDKTYLFAMNGQTGKTFGSLPICTKRLNQFCLIFFLVSFSISLFIFLYMGGINL